MFAFHMLTAGIWPFLWHWGIGVAIIILCLAGAFFSASIPLIGPWLAPLRKDLEWTAAATAVFLMAHALGARDEAAHNKARQVVIEQKVDDVVKTTRTPRARQQKDPYDSPNN